MMLEDALRWTEMLMALAFMQQSAEHLSTTTRAPLWFRTLFLARLILSALLLWGLHVKFICLSLAILGVVILLRFQGPYNGGADRMSLLLLFGVTTVHFVPDMEWKKYIFAYVALQGVLSYFVAGWVKIKNPDWRSGRALQDVFLFSVYPISENLRQLAKKPKILLLLSWAVILLEVLFPFALVDQSILIVTMICAALFHLANARFFGLNRFLWIWLASYPSILWLQGYVFKAGL